MIKMRDAIETTVIMMLMAKLPEPPLIREHEMIASTYINYVL